MRIPPLFSRLAACVLFLAAPLAAQAPAKHMLFRVRGPSGASVYLLGSVHLLSAEAGKLPSEVDSAYAHAKNVWFETSIDSVQMRAQELLTKARFADGKTLRSSLTPEKATKADSILKLYGLGLDQVGMFKPWFVGMVLSQLVVQKANFQAQYGVDMQLNARAKQDSKPVRGLESVDFQLNLFDSMAPADQEKMLLSAKGPEESAKQLLKIKDAWITGNVAQLDSIMSSDDDAPGMRAVVLTNRNANWVPQIEQMLKGTDDVLVVVGAAHLVGKQGVVELLKAKGYTVEQL
jgi:uncharacterized protein YbaP (TraB family)